MGDSFRIGVRRGVDYNLTPKRAGVLSGPVRFVIPPMPVAWDTFPTLPRARRSRPRAPGPPPPCLPSPNPILQV